MSAPKLHNKRKGTAPPGSVYIGRGTPWGNPFRVGKDGTREEVIAKFEAQVLPGLDVEPLRGKPLVCFCVPLRCHGHVIMRALYGVKP